MGKKNRGKSKSKYLNGKNNTQVINISNVNVDQNLNDNLQCDSNINDSFDNKSEDLKPETNYMSDGQSDMVVKGTPFKNEREISVEEENELLDATIIEETNYKINIEQSPRIIPVIKEKPQVEFQQKAIELISWNAQKDIFEIGEEAKQLMQNVKGPIGILAVAGVYRTGKSFLLNRCLLNQQNGNGFGVGPSINPCTKGLWVWGTPIIGYTENGEQLNVLIVDTEGIGGLDEDNNHDMRIFTLAILLSSYFLYNSMGSIDENALQNLSFVSSISKHINLKNENDQDSTNQKWEDNNNDNDLVQFMPKFMWTVRDFTLQLVNDQNNEITQKEYLEKALENFPGSGEEVQAKNEVKENLRKYFPERDCCTMVRPIVNEANLQSLDQINMEDLRPEFVEQIILLRKKVLHAMKPKCINGQPIDGSMWIALAEQYINAINGGTVPSIESSWTYICQNQAQEQFEQLKNEFEQGLTQDLTFPIAESELTSCFDYHINQFVQQLQKGFKNEKDILDKLQQQVSEYTKSRVQEITQHNLNECRQLSTNTLTSLFQELNSRFMSEPSVVCIGQNVRSLEITLQEVWSLYDQNVPVYQEKCLIFLNGKAQFLNDLLYFVHETLESECESTHKILNELQDRNHSLLQETKEQYRLEKQQMETKLKETMLSKAEIEASNELLKDQYKTLKEKKDSSEKEWQDSINELKNSFQKKLEEQRKDKEDFDEQMQTMSRNNIKVQSEFEKERALLDQKVQFLEKNLDEKIAKEKEHMNNWLSQNKELSGEIRQASQKYEVELKQLNILLDEEKEKSSELEATLQEFQVRFEDEKQQWKLQDQRQKEMLESALEQSRQMDVATTMMNKDSQLSIKLKEKHEQLDEMVQKIKIMEEKSLQNEEELKFRLQQIQKDMAIKDQQSEFVSIQLNETRVQLEEANKQHQSMVEAMQRQADQDNNQSQSADTENGIVESPLQEERISARLQQLEIELQQGVETCQELEIQLKLKETENEVLKQELLLKMEDLEQQKSAFAFQLSNSDSSQIKYLQQLEDKYKYDIARYELELEDKQQSHESDIQTIQYRSEESLAQLKNFYEIEKDKLESRLRDERDKAQKKISQYHEEFESKMRDEFSEKDEEMEILKDNFAELEARHNQQTTQVQHELHMKQQIIETLEKQNQECKGRIEMMESNRNQAFEKQLEFFESQRQEYNNKIDKLQSENLEKDRQLAQTSHKNERDCEDQSRKIKELISKIEIIERERDHLREKQESTKKKLGEAQDEAQQSQLIYGRDQALSQQSLQIEFLQRKIQEMQGQHDENVKQLESKISKYKLIKTNNIIDLIKNETLEDRQNQIERVQNERDLWEQKFDQKRKALKDTEITLNRENTELEKKICQLQENYSRLDVEKRRQEAEYIERITEAEAQIQNLDSSAGEAFYYGNAQAENLIQMKTNLQEYERQLSDLHSMYDKDKALWEGKCQFLENQKETYKKDLIESQRKFEMTLEQLQKRGNSAQNKYEHNQNAILKVLEHKYKKQIKEMLDQQSNLSSDLSSKNKKLEEENKVLYHQSTIGKKEMEMEIQQLKIRLDDQFKIENMIKNEVNELKGELEQKNQAHYSQTRSDKENYKQRMNEAERKVKEADSKRSQMVFDFEKEKARWQMEFDNIVNQKRELEDSISNLERRKDLLFKENERLKAESKANRRDSVDGRLSVHSSNNGMIPKLGAGLLNSLQQQSPGLPTNKSSVLKQKPGVLNQAKSPTGQPKLGQMMSQLPPQPQKYQFQMQQLNYNNQQNTRYSSNQDTNQDQETSSQQPQSLLSSSSKSQIANSTATAHHKLIATDNNNKTNNDTKTSSRYQMNNENY